MTMTDMTMSDTLELGGVSEASVGDYVALLKPRVMSLVVFTGFAGLWLAPGHLHPVLASGRGTLHRDGVLAPRAPSICGTTPISTG